jgi:hypothetical protein
MALLGRKKPIPVVLPDDNSSLEKERLEAERYDILLLRIFIIPTTLCFTISTFIMFSEMHPGTEGFALIWLVLVVYAYFPKDSSNHVIRMIEKVKEMGDDYEGIEKEIVYFFIDFDVTENRIRVLRYLMTQGGVLKSVATNLLERNGFSHSG